MPASLGVAALCAVAASTAILIRPDRKDEQYLALGAKYPASCGLNLPDGEAVLVDSRWLLTAAHLAKDIKVGTEAKKITIGEREYVPDRVVVHPDWESAGKGDDIAMVHLSEPVHGVSPVAIYRGTSEAGCIATMVGHGYSGTLESGPSPKEAWDHKKRGATNKVEKVVRGKWLMFLVDRPETATDLEGTSGPGDSGNPAFIEVEGTLYIAGIGSFTDDTTDDKIVGNFGDREAFTRVSRYAEWIDGVIAEKPAAAESRKSQ